MSITRIKLLPVLGERTGMAFLIHKTHRNLDSWCFFLTPFSPTLRRAHLIHKENGKMISTTGCCFGREFFKGSVAFSWSCVQLRECSQEKHDHFKNVPKRKTLTCGRSIINIPSLLSYRMTFVGHKQLQFINALFLRNLKSHSSHCFIASSVHNHPAI